jgi:hypothetical protein
MGTTIDQGQVGGVRHFALIRGAGLAGSKKKQKKEGSSSFLKKGGARSAGTKKRVTPGCVSGGELRF